eukprot:jgi/Ulvmu1/11741/UM008_0154.1
MRGPLFSPFLLIRTVRPSRDAPRHTAVTQPAFVAIVYLIYGSIHRLWLLVLVSSNQFKYPSIGAALVDTPCSEAQGCSPLTSVAATAAGTASPLPVHQQLAGQAHGEI